MELLAMSHPSALEQTSRQERGTTDQHRGTGGRATDKRSLQPRTPPGSVPAMGRILNLVANFKNPWINDPVEEAKHITAFKWAPAIDSWEAVIGSRNYIVVESLGTFLGAIEQQKEGAIVRINLWSHGNLH